MPVEAMTCPERALWYALRDIYSQFRRGLIDKRKGEELKLKALRQFDLDNQAISNAMKILKEHARFWQSVERTASAYRLERTLENADAFLEAVYNVPIKADQLEREGDN